MRPEKGARGSADWRLPEAARPRESEVTGQRFLACSLGNKGWVAVGAKRTCVSE